MKSKGGQQGTHAHGLAGRESRVIAAVRHPHLAACSGAHQYAADALGAAQPSVASRRRSRRAQACAALRISRRRACISSRSARGSGEAAAGAGARAAAAGERSAWHGAARAAARAALRSGRRTHRRRRHGLHGVGTEGRRLWRTAQAAVAVANLSLPVPRARNQARARSLPFPGGRACNRRFDTTLQPLPTLYWPASAAASSAGSVRRPPAQPCRLGPHVRTPQLLAQPYRPPRALRLCLAACVCRISARSVLQRSAARAMSRSARCAPLALDALLALARRSLPPWLPCC
jgi:hypothetical protein